MGNGQFLRLRLLGLRLTRCRSTSASPSRASSIATWRPASTCSTRRSTSPTSPRSRSATPAAISASASRSARTPSSACATRSRTTRSTTSATTPRSPSSRPPAPSTCRASAHAHLRHAQSPKMRRPQACSPPSRRTSPASAATSVLRSVAEARGYYPITDKITFVGRALGGNIEGWGGQDVRLTDLFFKGGETSAASNAPVTARVTLARTRSPATGCRIAVKTPSAVRCSGRPRPRCASRSRSSPRISACRAPSSPMLVRCGIQASSL